MADVKNIFKQVGDTLKKESKQVAGAVKKAEATVQAKAQNATNAAMHAGAPSAKAGVKPAGTGAKPAEGASGQAKPATAGAEHGSTTPKPFDFKLFMEATKTAFSKFFKEQVPWFFKNMGPAFKGFAPWWKKQKQDEQIAYAGWITGHVLMLVGIILVIVL